MQNISEDDSEITFLEEEINENYEPTDEEIIEYARFLGMNLKEDKDLLYIAKEGLKAPLPNPWKPCKKDNEIYYYNSDTKETTLVHPCDNYYKNYYQKEKQKKLEKFHQQQSKQLRY